MPRKRAIPAFLERFNGDDKVHLAGEIEQVEAVQFPLFAGGDGDLLRRNALVLHEVLPAPTAPNIAPPGERPRAGIMRQSWEGLAVSVTGDIPRR